jgi:hypothetical protein
MDKYEVQNKLENYIKDNLDSFIYEEKTQRLAKFSFFKMKKQIYRNNRFVFKKLEWKAVSQEEFFINEINMEDLFPNKSKSHFFKFMEEFKKEQKAKKNREIIIKLLEDIENGK